MTAPEKPRHQSGYSPEDLEQVKAVCLTIAVTLGAYLDDVCIVGGLVPALLIDTARSGEETERHPGTNDLDVGLAIALLDEQRYAEISSRLRAEGFKPDHNTDGNNTVQRWRLGELKVTIDFLIAPADDEQRGGRVHNLEPDFGALITPGLGLAFLERVLIDLDGYTLAGEHVRRRIPVSGPAAFVMLKALAFGDRGEHKDVYDLVYVIRHTPGRGATIAERLVQHAETDRETVERALGLLARDFADPGDVGPLRAADFISVDGSDRDADAADAHGYVDDLLRAAAALGLTPAGV